MTAATARANPRNLLTSLVLVFPLFLIYQVGVLYTLPMLNGADFLTILLMRNAGFSVAQYLIFTACVAAGFFLTVAVLRRTQRFDGRLLLPVLLESAIYALTMGSLIILVMTKVFGISPRLAAAAAPSIADGGLLTRLIMSIGAGVWEETLFRLGLLTACAASTAPGPPSEKARDSAAEAAPSSIAFSRTNRISSAVS